MRYDDVEVGASIGRRELPVRRLDLIRYCGASGDFNELHWNERAAKRAGLPDVIAHGMFTMARVGRLVTDWAGDPGAVVEYEVRFSRPVVVPDTDEGVTLVVEGAVAEKLGDGCVAVELTASMEGADVLSAVRAVVRLG
ncbi:MaoC/PaaZ C-terminal domain-containing protein [Saccharopolyspora erythraea]|uniref:MaoC/PaaZ C-terminal domain-containing protein n=1 Tax=Saccharopolyspora erythraea TaxID=1836 RepID=UPI001BA8ED0C|nr:MaoC/PaaZ C-terminal domain-containing protein [Saccharopolyspora erythraea]